jgi:hypothetical protein
MSCSKLDSYIEWEARPEKKEIAHAILEQKRFPYPPGMSVASLLVYRIRS